ncbi:MAG: response regulator [Acidimicrobiales bacterium]
MKQVLVIDDEPGIAELVSWCLGPLGVGVVLASGLQSALGAAGEGNIGLVLLDFNLGEEDGLEILPKLREDPNLKDVPFVAFTAHDSRRREALELGVSCFIGRPFASVDLRTAVELHLVR